MPRALGALIRPLRLRYVRAAFRRPGRPAGRGDQPAGVRPVEGRPGIGLAARRDVAVADQAVGRQHRVGSAEGRDNPRERPVLQGVVRYRVGAFELDANREVVAGGAALPARLARVPGPLAEFHILGDAAVAADAKMRGDALTFDLGKVRMRARGQVVGEQPVDPRAAELARRQADAVYHDQIRRHARRSRIAVRRGDLARARQDSASGVDLHAR